MIVNKMFKLILSSFLLYFTISLQAFASEDFNKWLAKFQVQAIKNGISKKIENSGGIILEGVCFYNMHAREIGEANGWKRLMSNSAKIINILGGYGYETILNSMEKCVISACQGKIVK